MKVEIHFAINVRKKYKKNSNLQKFIHKDKNFLEQYYLFQYKDLIRNMILKMKFQKKPYIYKTIEYFLQNNKKYLEKLKKYDIIIVVPLSWKRRLQRGYKPKSINSRNNFKYFTNKNRK